jgi:hypothetical protein
MHACRWINLSLMLSFALSACASMDADAPALPTSKTVGVVSAIGDEFTLTVSGLTGPDQNEQRFSIESWGIDDLIVSRTSALLGKGLQVKPLNYQRGAFAKLETTSPLAPMNVLRDDPLKKAVQTAVSPQGLDAYVVVTKAKAAHGSRGRSVSGIGLINHNLVFGSSTLVHALYTITLIAGNDFHVIAKRSAPPPANTEVLRIAGPCRVVDDTFLPTVDNAAQNEKLKGAVLELIEHSLPGLLLDLRLVDRSIISVQ